jgi:hypothetical protein
MIYVINPEDSIFIVKDVNYHRVEGGKQVVISEFDCRGNGFGGIDSNLTGVVLCVSLPFIWSITPVLAEAETREGEGEESKNGDGRKKTQMSSEAQGTVAWRGSERLR